MNSEVYPFHVALFDNCFHLRFGGGFTDQDLAHIEWELVGVTCQAALLAGSTGQGEVKKGEYVWCLCFVVQ